MQITSITEEEIVRIELATRNQADSKVWKKERQIRITASNFGSICKATDRRNFTLLATSLLNLHEFSSRATEHGKKYESVAVELYAKEYGHMYGMPEKCGLFICHEYPWLAASPDRVISKNILEVKCPFSVKDCTITPTTVPYLQLFNKTTVLNKQHIYYYQIQGQLYCTKKVHFT